MIMLPKTIQDNLHFLSVEVDSQLAHLESFFATLSPALLHRILDRAGYAYNLKMRIHSSCVNQLATKKKSNTAKLSLRSIELIATDLEHLTELARRCVREAEKVENIQQIQPQQIVELITLVRTGVQKLEDAVLQKHSQKAIKIGQLDKKIQKGYQQLKLHYTERLKQGKSTEAYIQGLFIGNAISQMGETLLQISEAIVSRNLGQPVNFDRYFSLQSLVDGLQHDRQSLQIKPIAETRSGSAIAGITDKHKDGEYVAIFKDGEKRKVKEERQGVKSWHQIYPGLAPKILSYEKRNESAALLIEHLPGHTIENIVLNESQALLTDAFKHLTKTLKSVWQATKIDEPVTANFIGQMTKRMPEVYKVHPEFVQKNSVICGSEVSSFDHLAVQAKAYEAQLSAPFSVHIHGDFNLDNIIYDPLEKRINFIDLHRSRYMDYVQDVSVFMVSNYRLQILDKPIRRKIMGLAKDFYQVSRRYALSQGDASFDLRVALGLARSFATSTRFILDKSLARRMFLRSQYLLQLVIATDINKANKFKIPLKEIFID